MKKYFKINLLLMLLAVISIHLNCVKEDNRSQIQDKGITSYDLISVYHFVQASGAYEKSKNIYVSKNAEVYTIDQNGAPISKKVIDYATGESRELSYIIFRNSPTEGWTYGFVLKECFTWQHSDTTFNENTVKTIATDSGKINAKKVGINSTNSICDFRR